MTDDESLLLVSTGVSTEARRIRGRLRDLRLAARSHPLSTPRTSKVANADLGFRRCCHCAAGSVGRRCVGPRYPSSLGPVRGGGTGRELTTRIDGIIGTAAVAVHAVIAVGAAVVRAIVPAIVVVLRCAVDRPTNGTGGWHCTE